MAPASAPAAQEGRTRRGALPGQVDASKAESECAEDEPRGSDGRRGQEHASAIRIKPMSKPSCPGHLEPEQPVRIRRPGTVPSRGGRLWG